jgi:flagellar export protein FliJ
MTTLPHASVDMRAFTWPLLPLERKLEWERDAARARLAQALAALRRSQSQLRELEALRQQQARRAAATLRQTLDPRSHRQFLAYLVSIQQQQGRARQHLQSLERALAAARAECAHRERTLESLVAARARAMRAYIAGALLSQDRQADTAWLVHDQRARVRAARQVAP